MLCGGANEILPRQLEKFYTFRPSVAVGKRVWLRETSQTVKDLSDLPFQYP